MPSQKDLVQTIQCKMTTFLESSPAHDICQKAGAAAGLDKVVVFEVAIFSGLLLMVLVVGAETVVNLVCFVYPCVSSVKAVERGLAADRTHWVTYWMTFFAFQTIESAMPSIWSSIPFFFWIKLALMVWCYHPVTRGSSVIYKHMEPIRDEVMPFLDFMLDGILPASSKPSGQPAAQKKTNKAENQYVPSGITVHLDSLEMTQVEGSAEDGTASADVPRALYVEIYLASAVEGTAEPKCIGARYKTPPLTGTILNFDYKLTLIPPTDILNQPGANLCFTVKERMTFGDDPVVFNIHTPLDISTLQSPERTRSESPESDGDLVSVSVGRRPVVLKSSAGSIKGWIELISER